MILSDCVVQGANIAECNNDKMSSNWFDGTTDERYVIWFFRDPADKCNWKTHDRYSTNKFYNLKEKLEQTLSTLLAASKACSATAKAAQKSTVDAPKESKATSDDKTGDNDNGDDTKKPIPTEVKDEKQNPAENKPKPEESKADAKSNSHSGTSEGKTADNVKDTKKPISTEIKDEKNNPTENKSKATESKPDIKPKTDTRCPIVIDTRTQQEWDEGHASCAHRLEIQNNHELVEKVLGLAKGDPSHPVQLYCRSGNRAGQALKVMQDKQWTSVTNAGGWKSGQMDAIKKLCECDSGTSEDKTADNVKDTKKPIPTEVKDENPKPTEKKPKPTEKEPHSAEKKPKPTPTLIPDAKRGLGGGVAILSDNGCVTVRSRRTPLLSCLLYICCYQSFYHAKIL